MADPGAPLQVSCAAAAALTLNTWATGGKVETVSNPGTGGVLITDTSATWSPVPANCPVGGKVSACEGAVLEFTSGPHAGLEYDIATSTGSGSTLLLGEPLAAGTIAAGSAGDTFIVKDVQSVTGGITLGSLYGPPYPGDNGSGSVPTAINPCPNVADLTPSPGFLENVGTTTDTVLTALASAGIGIQAPVVIAAAPGAVGTLDWRIREAGPIPGAGDLDSDTIPNELDNCMWVPQTPTFGTPAGIPGNCDTDWDGFGNACDGDFNQTNSTTGADFNPGAGMFLPEFSFPTTPGTGTDMNCSGPPGVTGADFHAVGVPGGFLNNYLAPMGYPGPSGYACAGTFYIKNNCLGAGDPVPCCTGAGQGVGGNSPIGQFCSCP
jgi:hypothetical protein